MKHGKKPLLTLTWRVWLLVIRALIPQPTLVLVPQLLQVSTNAGEKKKNPVPHLHFDGGTRWQKQAILRLPVAINKARRHGS
jgi:hypothetical protein